MRTKDCLTAAGIVLMCAACSFLQDMGKPLETPEPVVLRAAPGDGALRARDRVALRIGLYMMVLIPAKSDSSSPDVPTAYKRLNTSFPFFTESRTLSHTSLKLG